MDLYNYLVIVYHLLHEPGVSEEGLGTGPVRPGVEEDADGLHHRPHQLRGLGEGSDLGEVLPVQSIQGLPHGQGIASLASYGAEG